jgi:hypothetical protein
VRCLIGVVNTAIRLGMRVDGRIEVGHLSILPGLHQLLVDLGAGLLHRRLAVRRHPLASRRRCAVRRSLRGAVVELRGCGGLGENGDGGGACNECDREQSEFNVINPIKCRRLNGRMKLKLLDSAWGLIIFELIYRLRLENVKVNS